MRLFFTNIFELLYPRICPACGDKLPRGEHTLCLKCWWDMPLTRYWLQPENYAVDLFAGRFPFEHASSLFFFRSRSRYRELIHHMKYGGRRDVARALGEMYGHELAGSPIYQGYELLIPIPLHWTKRIKRGYNQAEDICIGLRDGMNNNIKCEFNALKRIRATRTQAMQHGHKARWENVGGAFELRNPERLRGRKIILVDDVLTTGATIESAALAIIKQLPDAQISIVTLAMVRKNAAG